MKNLLAIFLMVFLFASCEGPMGPPGLDGEDGGITEWLVDKDITVYPRDWKLVNNHDGNPFYMYEYKIKDADYDLYLDAYDYGLVTTYMYLDYNDDIEAQTALPNPIDKMDENDNSITWRETYASEHTRNGFIIFKMTISDFFIEEGKTPPETHFKLVITY